MSTCKNWKLPVAAALAFVWAVSMSAEPLPSTLAGSWRITRILPTKNISCWSEERARALVGSTLNYRTTAMRWKAGEVPLQDIVTRTVTAAQFSKENGDSAAASSATATFTQLGIRSGRVLEVDLQHEDADITGVTTEVPGDSVLMVSPNRIIVSACGVFYEATRAASVTRTAAVKMGQ